MRLTFGFPPKTVAWRRVHVECHIGVSSDFSCSRHDFVSCPVTLVREPASSGPLYLAPVSPKSSKNRRFGHEKRMFFELFADTGAKKSGPELAGSLINAPTIRRSRTASPSTLPMEPGELEPFALPQETGKIREIDRMRAHSHPLDV